MCHTRWRTWVGKWHTCGRMLSSRYSIGKQISIVCFINYVNGFTGENVDAWFSVKYFPIMTLSQLVAETRKLPSAQRAELADRIAIELARKKDPAVEEAWAEVAQQRLAEVERGKAKPVAGKYVMARARKIIGR